MRSSTVLILGASGRFGKAACQAFTTAGWRVLAQSRGPQLWLPATAQALILDPLDTSALCRASKGADVIVNALNPPYTQWQKLALPLATSALNVAKANGALLMLPGNVYNFGHDLPAELHVATPQIGSHDKARIRITMEQQLQAAAEEGINSVIVRAGDFFDGPVRGSWFDLAISKYLQRGKMVYPGPYDTRHAWAYLPDLATCFVMLAEKKQVLTGTQTFHFAGHAVTGDELHQALQIVCERPLDKSTLPWHLISLATPFSPMLRAIAQMRYLWQKPHALYDDRLAMLLGHLPHTPLTQALAEALTALEQPVATDVSMHITP